MKEVIKERQGLYRQEFEHDNCGIGAVVNIKGKKTHDTVANALQQINEKDYDCELLSRGIQKENIFHYGLAFEGKKVLIG